MREPSLFRRVALATAVALSGGTAAAAERIATPPPDVCSLVRPAEIGALVGYTVEEPDETSRSADICFFTPQGMSQDASATYSLVTQANLMQRRALAAARSRRCAGVVAESPNYLLCASYARVANASDIDAYFMARTSFGDPVAVPSLGVRAFATPSALEVRTSDGVIEVVIRRGDDLDVDAETKLARLLLVRLHEIPDAPPRRPKHP